MDTIAKMLTIDLTAGHITVDPLDETIVRHYLGGRGFNVWQMRESVQPEWMRTARRTCCY